jgi:hypothetical protein
MDLRLSKHIAFDLPRYGIAGSDYDTVNFLSLSMAGFVHLMFHGGQ